MINYSLYNKYLDVEMQLTKKLEIQSKQKIIEFLNSEPVGRIASIDVNGYPQVSKAY
ncbi:MAG: hypothetical protein WBZ36_14065 [Candidatus Nitrosopolaris sp.]